MGYLHPGPGRHVLVAPGKIRPLAWLGIAVWLVGFLFESIGDWQLVRFKADPANRGKIMQTGLWRYTRHPNYFGDACVWWGLFLIASDNWLGLLTVFAPLRNRVFAWLWVGVVASSIGTP